MYQGGIVSFKGQGAFEYMVSYGWAILIVVVLGILLFSLGVFNPSQTPTASGFVFIKPVSWSFSGGETHYSNVTMAVENVAGQNLVTYINSTGNQSIRFKQGSSGNCYFQADSRPVTVTDASGNSLEVTNEKVSIPVGGIVTMTGRIGASNCGGLKSSSYRYNIYITSIDEYGVEKTDTGLLTGKYV